MPPDDPANQSPETQDPEVEEVDLDALVGSAVDEKLKALGVGGDRGGAPPASGEAPAGGGASQNPAPVPASGGGGSVEEVVRRVLGETDRDSRLKSAEEKIAALTEPAPPRKGIAAALFGKERKRSSFLTKLGL